MGTDSVKNAASGGAPSKVSWAWNWRALELGAAWSWVASLGAGGGVELGGEEEEGGGEGEGFHRGWLIGGWERWFVTL